MTITFQGIEAGLSGTHGKDESWKYVFRSDDATDRVQDVVRNRLCPYIGQQHPEVRYLWLKPGGLSIRQDSSDWSKWVVTAKWSTLEPGEDPPRKENPNAPTIELPDFKPRVTIHFEEFTVPLGSAFEADEDGIVTRFPVVNSALEPYDPLPEVPRLNTILRVNANFQSSDPQWPDINKLNNTVDKNGWTYKRGPFEVKANPYESKFKFEIGEKVDYVDEDGKDDWYSNVTLQAIVNRQGWRILLLDVGSYYFPANGPTIAERQIDNNWTSDQGKVPFYDNEDNPKQGLLNGFGGALEASPGANPFFNTYDGYKYTEDHESFIKIMTAGE